MLFALVAVFGCHGRMEKSSFASDADFDLSISLNRVEVAFDLTLTSKSAKRLCLDIDQWPNSRGQLHMGADLAHVSVDGQRYRAADRNFGYCAGEKCILRIEPSQQLMGRIAFSEFAGFSDVKDISAARLNFSVRPRYC